jgi:hypothetical protein
MFAGQEFDKLETPLINCSLTYTKSKEPYMEDRLEEFGFMCLALRVMEAVHGACALVKLLCPYMSVCFGGLVIIHPIFGTCHLWHAKFN